VDFLCYLAGLWQLSMVNLHFFEFLLFYFLVHMLIVGFVVMQSVKRIAVGWIIWELNPSGSKIFIAHPDQP
jgi:hypothetical protein